MLCFSKAWIFYFPLPMVARLTALVRLLFCTYSAEPCTVTLFFPPRLGPSVAFSLRPKPLPLFPTGRTDFLLIFLHLEPLLLAFVSQCITRLILRPLTPSPPLHNLGPFVFRSPPPPPSLCLCFLDLCVRTCIHDLTLTFPRGLYYPQVFCPFSMLISVRLVCQMESDDLSPASALPCFP